MISRKILPKTPPKTPPKTSKPSMPMKGMPMMPKAAPKGGKKGK